MQSVFKSLGPTGAEEKGRTKVTQLTTKNKKNTPRPHIPNTSTTRARRTLLVVEPSGRNNSRLLFVLLDSSVHKHRDCNNEQQKYPSTNELLDRQTQRTKTTQHERTCKRMGEQGTVDERPSEQRGRVWATFASPLQQGQTTKQVSAGKIVNLLHSDSSFKTRRI